MSSAALSIAQHEIVSHNSTQTISQSIGDDIRHDSTRDNSDVAICDLHDKTIHADLTHGISHSDTLTNAERQNVRSLSTLNSKQTQAPQRVYAPSPEGWRTRRQVTGHTAATNMEQPSTEYKLSSDDATAFRAFQPEQKLLEPGQS